ncbi:DNA replication licensing factor mcm10 [Purpureocillium lavendulum]|uniref:DNA replication licensing factor mcm10 n=1 Tax=Purpureocillium lavendulum TaxID=1247861 RepID=A0AB34FG34_9HYPO|nr:DNA replication licensing factor mcm10 [Purpureocillium lavendulum]
MTAASLSPGGRLGVPFDEDEDDEDEETLQLKLQEIQARLRLKKLQNAKNKESRAHDDGHHTQPLPAGIEPGRNARESTPGADDSARLAIRNQVQVPASPIRRTQAPMQQTSPSRVLLGIDKGLKAKDISLKRAPSSRSTTSGRASRGGGYLEKSRSTTSISATQEAARPLSFNERLASARTEEAFRATREEKIRQVRTNAFGIDKQEMEEYKKRAVDISDEPIKAPTYTRDQILSRGKATGLPRSRTVPNVAAHADAGESSSFTERSSQDTARDGEEEASSFEPYSCFHLSRRILPHRVLARHVSGKKTMNIKELLRDVKAPNFELPDVEQDIVAFGIVAKKSEPRAHKQTEANKNQEDRGKYMVVTLCDLDFELDLFLFDSGFTRFWKLTEGTVVAILNPGLMPPPPGRVDTGRFSLVINSDADTIIEIGAARDLGFCQSIKKDGSMCGAWVNKKRTQFCEFHSNEALRKQRSTRMEVNATGFGDRRHGGGRGGGGGGGGGSKEWNGKKKGPDNYDWETRTQWFASRSFSAADLIDGKDRVPADRKERAEFLKRSMEAKEKEREMMKQLGKVGNAAGREYMLRAGGKKADGDSLASSASLGALSMPETADGPPKLDAASLGLQSRDRAIHLSPIKRKRPESSQAGSTAGSSSAKGSGGFGWGSNLRNKLTNMKDGERLHTQKSGSKSPVRKKTRFVTEKGIREAGRESLGVDANGDVAGRRVSLDDDDDGDELIIVK